MTTETTTETPEVQEAITIPDEEIEVPEGWQLISDEQMQSLADQLVEDNRQTWQIQDIADSAVIAGEELDMIRDEYFYEFEQGGKIIRGLTAKMIGDLATANGISEVTEERKHIGDDPEATHHSFDVVVEIPDPKNPDRMLKRSGFAEEPKQLYGKHDKFAKIKAYTKAFRRACEKLLPQALLIATKFKLARIVPADWTPKQPQQKALPPADNGRATARKAMYAQYGERKAELEALGITEDILKAGILSKFEVETTTELTEAQYVETREALTGELAKWITDLAPKTDETEKESEIHF